MQPPSLSDWDKMFSAFDSKDQSEDLNKRAWRLLKVAKDSKPFMGALEGLFKATMSGVTLGGIQLSPIAMTLLVGFVLGGDWEGKTGTAQEDPDSLIIDSYLRELEQKASEFEKPKGTEENNV